MTRPLEIMDGVRCLQQLFTASPEAGLGTADIARAEGLDPGVALDVLTRLVGAGLVELLPADRYRLARTASRIRVHEVQTALGGKPRALGAYGRLTLADVCELENRFFEPDHAAVAA